MYANAMKKYMHMMHFYKNPLSLLMAQHAGASLSVELLNAVKNTSSFKR